MEIEDWWAKKVELPNFSGTDPIGWVARAEKFFVEHEIYGFDRVQWAFMSLDASMLFLFRSWDQENPNPTWESFSTCLIRRFGTRNYGCKADEDKTHKQILCEMVKQEEKGKHEDEETGSWSQKILTSNVSLLKLSNQESCTMTNEIQTPLPKQSVVHQLAESFGHTASLALVEPPPLSEPLGVDHFEAEKKENGVSKHHKLMQELKTDIKLLKEGIAEMKSGIKELILVSRSKSKTVSGQFLISLVPCEIKERFLELKEKPKSTTEMEDSIKNGHTTSANQLCTARGLPSENQEPSEKSESIKSGKLTEKESMKKDSEKEENPVSHLWLKKETSHALNDPFGWMNSARKFFLIQKTFEEDERSIKDLNSGNLDMEEIMFSDKQTTVAEEEGSSHCIMRKGTGSVSIKIPASLVLSPDWKVQLETTGITVIGKPTTKELHLMAYLLIVAPPPPPKPPDLKDSSNELPHLKVHQ